MTTNASDYFQAQVRPARVGEVRGHGYRLDAGFHASSARDVLETLAMGHASTRKISELAHTFGLSDFGLMRIPADKDYGVPFYTVSDIQEQEPIPRMFLSKACEPNLSDYLVYRGYVLVSRSGSVGNVILAGSALDGKAVANHAIRIVAKTPEWSSLIYVALSGSLGNNLLKNLQYGSVIDQIKSFQIDAISIPIPEKEVLEGLHSRIARASDFRDQAAQLLTNARSLVLASNKLPVELQAASAVDPHGDIEVVKLSSAEISSSAGANEFRLEENFYNPIARTSIARIERSPSLKRTVGELSRDVILCGRFKRNYVESEYGTPFLSGRNIVQVRPTDLNHLSNSETEDMQSSLLQRGWVLVTRSGTVGRTCFVWDNFEKFAASEHILRVLPDEAKIDGGYLYAFLSSEYGYEQIIRFRYGSVIDEITDQQLKKVIVPVPSRERQREIGDLVRTAYEMRAKALSLEDEAQNILLREIEQRDHKERPRV